MFSRTLKDLFCFKQAITLPTFTICLLGLSGALAENYFLQLVEPFFEAFFDGTPQSWGTRGVVGASIVGLRLDEQARPFDPRSVRILLGDNSPKPQLLCARFLSRDGRYFARGRYKLTDTNDPAPLLDFQTRFGQQLKDYSTTDFAMLAVAGDSCDELRTSQLFVVHNGDGKNVRELIVLVRAGDARLHAQLSRNNAAVGPSVLCAPPTNGPMVGYTNECALPLPTPLESGSYQLSIGETGSNGEIVVSTYLVVLTKP